jgi:hypothetical protein
LIAVKRGDFKAYSILVRGYQDFANKVALNFTKDEKTAAELTIVTFMRLWNKRSELATGTSVIACICKCMRDIVTERESSAQCNRTKITSCAPTTPVNGSSVVPSILPDHKSVSE